jgi:hypothetical protein
VLSSRGKWLALSHSSEQLQLPELHLPPYQPEPIYIYMDYQYLSSLTCNPINQAVMLLMSTPLIASTCEYHCVLLTASIVSLRSPTKQGNACSS